MEVSLDAILKELEADYRVVAQPAPAQTGRADVAGVSLLEKRAAADPRTLYVCDALRSKTKPFIPRGATVVCIGDPGKTAANAARLVIVDGECDLAGLFNCIQRVIDRYAALERSLLQAVASQASAQVLVDLVTPFLGNEVIVMEADFRTVAHSYPEVKLLASSGLEQLDAEGRNPVELVTFFSNDASYRDVASLTEPFYYEKSIFSHRVYCANIFSRGEYVSRCVLCEIDKPITPFDEYVFTLFARYMQMAYDLAGGSKAGFAGYLPGVFKGLLSGSRVDEARLGMLLAQRGWKDGDRFVCFSARVEGYVAGAALVAYHSSKISSGFDDVIAIEHDGMVAGVANLKSYGSEAELVKALSLYQREANLRVGYGDPFRSFADLRTHYEQARIALQVGLAARPTSWTHRFRDCFFDYLGQKMGEDLPLPLLAAAEVTALRDHDRANETEYVETLRAYLECGGNALKTASALNIHRGTMAYRLKRIAEIGNVDFDDADRMLHIMLTLRVFTQGA